MGIVVVDVCDANAIMNLDIIEILESEFPEVSVLNSYCLSQCALCSARPFALVNNKRVYAKTPEECLEKIRATIREELAAYQ